jgi:hypothetical protein
MIPSWYCFVAEAAKIAREVDNHPQLWNQHGYRTQHPKSPHREAPDIWLRYNAIENLNEADPYKFNEEHEAVWYPAAALLPSVQPLAERLAYLHGARKIGAVLITKVPAGKQIYWHSDRSWHADNHRKWLVLLRGNEGQSFEFEGEQLYARPGECFEFMNAYPHQVLNPTSEDRMSLIVCLRDFE